MNEINYEHVSNLSPHDSNISSETNVSPHDSNISSETNLSPHDSNISSETNVSQPESNISSEFIVLNRLSIIGLIDRTIPKCVFLQILTSHGIDYTGVDPDNIYYFSYLLMDLYDKPLKKVTSKGANVYHIARFINPNVIWSKDNLIKAFNHLMSFTDKESFKQFNICGYSETGWKTEDLPYSYDSTILYAYCKHLGLTTHWETTNLDMFRLISLYFNRSCQDITNHITSHIKQINNNNLNKSQLISLLSLTNVNLDVSDTHTSRNKFKDRNRYRNTDMSRNSFKDRNGDRDINKKHMIKSGRFTWIPEDKIDDNLIQ